MRDNNKKEQVPFIPVPTSVEESFKQGLKEVLEEQTKFTITNNMNTDLMLDWFTEYIDKHDVYRMNQINVWNNLLPHHYAELLEDKTNDKLLKDIMEINSKHVKEHKRNMVSLKRKREKAIVEILHNDNGVVTSPKNSAFFGLK